MTFDPRAPFRSGQARTAGITRATLRGPRYRRLLRDCYVAADVPVTEELLAHAALAVVPSAAGLSHYSAAGVWELPAPRTADVDVAVPEGTRCTVDGVRTHGYSAPPAVTRHRGLPVTEPVQTFLDLAGELDLVDQVVLGDATVRRELCPAPALVHCAERYGGRGARRARRAAALVRAGVDSPMETRVRLLLVLAGLPEPAVNHVIRDERGEVRRRLDLSYPQFKLAIEYDGRHHIRREQQWRADLLRREQFEAGGWRFVVLVSQDVYGTPGRTLARITDAMRRCGMTVPVLHADWRRHFPGRPSASLADRCSGGGGSGPASAIFR